MQAKDIMTINVISVTEDSPVHEVVGLNLDFSNAATFGWMNAAAGV